MALMTISEVSGRLGISARMLRYYEKKGMIESIHREGYAYRMYDENTVRRISQIMMLRKLQLPLKKIRIIVDGNRQDVLGILNDQLVEIEKDIASMQIVKEALCKMSELFRSENKGDYLPEDLIADMVKLLPAERYRLNGSSRITAEDRESRVRIILLPPCTVASYRYVGANPEETVGEVMDKFIRSERLYEKKPDSRLFGFNPPDYEAEEGIYGYENWVTVPDDMEVPAPLSKKHFDGGLYAAYTISFPDFWEWEFLKDWIKGSDRYQAACTGGAEGNMGGCLEEHLNWVYSSHAGWPQNGIDGKVDLLLPIKPK